MIHEREHEHRVRIVSYLFSTSNHNQVLNYLARFWIVSYLFSTSNHNPFAAYQKIYSIVSYLFSTSNHNEEESNRNRLKLSLTFFLHQTTTPTLKSFSLTNCLLPFFYIKPQPSPLSPAQCAIVSYLFSTSNHNSMLRGILIQILSLTFFLHQTTTISVKTLVS